MELPQETISAGGILVKSIQGKPYIVLIRRREYSDWALPKGHVEADETIEEAALREVAEEAGLKHVKIISLLGTYERYREETNEQKTIHYFLMEPTQDEEFAITEDNKNDEIAWLSLGDLPPFYLNEQKDLIEKNFELIRKHAKENPS